MSGLFCHEKVPYGIIAAKTVGITSAAFLTGMNTFISVAVVPATMQAPAGLAAAQWKTYYSTGAKVAPPTAIVGALASGYMAWREGRSSPSFKFWLTSAVSVFSIIPWTFLTMLPTNNKLKERTESLSSTELTDKSAEAGVAKEETVNALLDKWATLNLGRAILTGIASVTACLATLNKLEVVGVQEIGLASGANRLG